MFRRIPSLSLVLAILHSIPSKVLFLAYIELVALLSEGAEKIPSPSAAGMNWTAPLITPP